MATYIIIVTNPIVAQEVMRVETDNRDLAMIEAAHLSSRHGVARVYEESEDREIACFRYGSEQPYLA
ncbi:MAG TPA: hypothetical protein VIG62_10230 [Blastocatellia bacterium]